MDESKLAQAGFRGENATRYLLASKTIIGIAGAALCVAALRKLDQTPAVLSSIIVERYVGLLVQTITYCAASMALVRMSWLGQPYMPFAMFQRVPPAAGVCFALAMLSLFVLGPALGYGAVRGARNGKLLLTPSLFAATPFFIVIVAIVAHALGV